MYDHAVRTRHKLTNLTPPRVRHQKVGSRRGPGADSLLDVAHNVELC